MNDEGQFNTNNAWNLIYFCLYVRCRFLCMELMVMLKNYFMLLIRIKVPVLCCLYLQAKTRGCHAVLGLQVTTELPGY